MAATLQPLRLTARSCTCRGSLNQYIMQPIVSQRRGLSTTRSRWNASTPPSSKGQAATPRPDFKNPAQALVNMQTPIKDIVESEDWDAEERALMERVIRDGPTVNAPMMEKSRRKKPKDTFLNYGDPDPWEEDGQLEDDHDDITTLGHGELERHREMRHYARLAAWEMPLLANMAKAFVPPTADMPLRFRYTSYLGEKHPAAKKVVVEFSPADMPNLTPIQREKLKKLVGVRYNPDKDIVKMNCEMFETQAQNKRYLGDLVDKLLHESRTGDTFEDIPLDLRHHRVKATPKFPAEWALTEERKKELARIRGESEQRDIAGQLAGQVLDGTKQIEEGIAKAAILQERIPEMAVKGKKKVAVRRN